MINFSLRPSGDFIWTAEYRELYVLTEHWQSDLKFYKGDLHFLYQLIDKYFIWLVNQENLDEMRTIATGLSESVKNCDILLEKTSKHLAHLAELIDDPFKYDSHKFRSEHEELENEIVSFIKKFWKIKKDTFVVSEHVIARGVERLNP